MADYFEEIYNELSDLQKANINKSYNSYKKIRDFYRKNPSYNVSSKDFSFKEYVKEYLQTQDYRKSLGGKFNETISRELATEDIITKKEAVKILKDLKDSRFTSKTGVEFYAKDFRTWRDVSKVSPEDVTLIYRSDGKFDTYKGKQGLYLAIKFKEGEEEADNAFGY